MYRRILTIQDVSCVGQCSLTVALPILSACGLETAVLPSAVLSTHTAGFTGFTFRDLTDDMPEIEKHWKKEGIKFDAVYTGYLGSEKQIEHVCSIMDNTLNNGGYRIVDPAMADNGKLYSSFDMNFVSSMKGLCSKADIVLPNITEACLLTGKEYRNKYEESYIKDLVDSLSSPVVILTGVSYSQDTTGVFVKDHGKYKYYRHKKIANGCHGTGDVYASAFTGALMRGKTSYESAVIAADYVVRCIEATQGDQSHWYGVKFEMELGYLINMIEEK